jgi:hypothetical protein
MMQNHEDTCSEVANSKFEFAIFSSLVSAPIKASNCCTSKSSPLGKQCPCIVKVIERSELTGSFGCRKLLPFVEEMEGGDD